jgi:hypothetical protein
MGHLPPHLELLVLAPDGLLDLELLLALAVQAALDCPLLGSLQRGGSGEHMGSMHVKTCLHGLWAHAVEG